MVNIITGPEQKRVNTISQEVSDIYIRYKERIEKIIYNNYGLKKEEKLLGLFKRLGIILSDRNNELLTLLEDKYGLNLRKDFDFTGGLRFSKNIINKDTPESIKLFFKENYTRVKGDNIHSRGYGYYFNFDGFGVKKGNYTLNVGEYLNGLSKYYFSTIAYLGEFNGKKTSNLSKNEKKLLLVGLEHYKNILFFLQNFIISISDKKYLTKHVLNLSSNTFNKYFLDVSNKEDLLKLNNWIKSELEKVITDFCDLSLGINFSIKKSRYSKSENISKILSVFSNLYEGSFNKQKIVVSKLKNRRKIGGKQTNIKGIETAINRFNNKLISKLIRIIREADNPIKELFACHNISQNIPEEIKGVDIIGLLYGGIEMPYIMKYIFSRFLDKNIDNISIQLLGLSTYSNRNLMQTSALGNYKPINGDNKNTEGRRLQLVLDDNSYYGTSLQVASNIGTSKGPVYSGVAEIGLRRRTIGKLYEGSNINHLLSKISDSASVTPIERHRGTYRNIVSNYILKKLPGLVGSL